jgi:hypothetical protein
MALPTVQYARIPAGTNVNLMSICLPQLQSLLLAAGWTIIAADSDAIGTGSFAAPAWDKTPASSVSAGKVIYLMPANDFTRQWYVEIEGWWHTGTSNVGFRVKVGTGESGGALTGATANTYNFAPNSTTIGSESIMAASEDGFAFVFTANSSGPYVVMSVERARTMAGVVGEDLVIQGNSGVNTSGALIGFTAGECARIRATDGFEYAIGKWFGLASMSSGFSNWNASNTNGVNNMNDASGEISVPMGPFAFSGVAAGVPRLVFYLHPVNVITGTDHPVFVDGASRLYRTPTATLTNLVAAMVARE